MKFLKLLLFCFLIFCFGNFKSQNNFEEKAYFITRNILNLEANYFQQRNDFKLNENLILKIKNLKKIYLQELDKKIHKSKPALYYYFKYYPDINAVLFNRNNFLSDKKLSDEEKQKYSEMILEIAKQIPNETYLKISKITDEINKDKIRLIIPYKLEIFQDFLDENARKRIEIVNFLLWKVE